MQQLESIRHHTVRLAAILYAWIKLTPIWTERAFIEQLQKSTLTWIVAENAGYIYGQEPRSFSESDEIFCPVTEVARLRTGITGELHL